MRRFEFSVTLFVGVAFGGAFGAQPHEIGPANLLNTGLVVRTMA
jgi:hypothetical protein